MSKLDELEQEWRCIGIQVDLISDAYVGMPRDQFGKLIAVARAAKELVDIRVSPSLHKVSFSHWVLLESAVGDLEQE